MSTLWVDIFTIMSAKWQREHLIYNLNVIAVLRQEFSAEKAFPSCFFLKNHIYLFIYLRIDCGWEHTHARAHNEHA